MVVHSYLRLLRFAFQDSGQCAFIVDQLIVARILTEFSVEHLCVLVADATPRRYRYHRLIIIHAIDKLHLPDYSNTCHCDKRNIWSTIGRVFLGLELWLR